MDSAPQHRLSAVDPVALMADCAICGQVDVYKRHASKGFMCGRAQRHRMLRLKEAKRLGVQLGKRPYLEHRAGTCARCGHVPLVDQALSVHHYDGNHRNNAPSNLVTLCLNCHAEVHSQLRTQEDAELAHGVSA